MALTRMAQEENVSDSNGGGSCSGVGLVGLPQELVHHIISFLAQSPSDLHSCVLVSWRLYEAACPMLWKSVSLNSELMMTRWRYALQTPRGGAQLARHVRYLQIVLPPQVSPHHLADLMPLAASRCTHIQKFKLEFAGEISVAGLSQLCLQNRRLESIDLSRSSCINDNHVIAVSRARPNLRSLRLDYCKELTDAAVEEVAMHCRHLRKLTLNGCDRLGDVAVGAIGQGLPRLRNLYLSYCTRVTDASILLVSQSCPDLRKLILWGCYRITDRSLFAIGLHCKSLNRILLGHCSRTTADGVKRLLLGCPDLQTLNLARCVNCSSSEHSDEFVHEIAAHCGGIRHLYFDGWKNLSDDAMRDIAKHCRKLEVLGLDYNECVSEEATREILRINPSLQIDRAKDTSRMDVVVERQSPDSSTTMFS